LSAGVRQYATDEKNQKHSAGGSFSSIISFAAPSYTPSITIPFTSEQFSFTGKIGQEFKVVHPSYFISGYVSRQFIARADTLLGLPAYGYLHYQEGAKNSSALLDFNREKELIYHEKPATPHIAVPVYTYDAFSITGEGTGGMFRAYRGDIGFVHDHFIRSKDESNRVSVDIGITDVAHGGIDLNVNRAFTQNGPWLNENTLKNIINFRDSSGIFEHAYFRNPGEKAINSKQFQDAIGGDDVVAVELSQAGISDASILATNYLTRFRNKRAVGRTLLTPQNTIRTERDKRTQVISYLTSKEASIAGLSKYIESYTANKFDSILSCRPDDVGNVEGSGVGLFGEYFDNTTHTRHDQIPKTRTDATLNFNWDQASPMPGQIPDNKFSIRWTGRVLAPATGEYIFTATSDDGVRLWLNDLLLINEWTEHAPTAYTAKVNLVEGEMYNIRVEHYDNKHSASFKLEWSYPGQATQIVPQDNLFYPPAKDTFALPNVVKELRVNRYRKDNHISEIDVLNNDGRRYVYGIPVYNLKQKEATFAINSAKGNSATGLTGYDNVDNSASNTNGKDNYYNSEEVPAYAHSFLLTGILSADYVDLTGNGISDDDLGNAVKINYSKVAGINNPYKWRAPFVTDSVTYNEGLKTDNRDDKGNFIYGEKELWYLHSIESRTMIATFTVESRLDQPAIDARGNKYNDSTAKRLKEINLYSKADFAKNPHTAKPVKTVHFEYSYELCKGVNKPYSDSGKLTLKRVWFSYNGNNKGK
ncbi:MAG TPA: PA14 domain-containing protein, partial [Chitinophagaceae bacterium]|nr:PA14 domain-containing protein [Chitinophagaceae bacterium]